MKNTYTQGQVNDNNFYGNGMQTGANLNEQINDNKVKFFGEEETNTHMDGRNIGDKKPIREIDPKVDEAIDGNMNELEIEIGAIQNGEYIEEGITAPTKPEEITDLQEKDIGEGNEDMPLARKELDDQTDEYQINGTNIKDITIEDDREGIGIEREPISWKDQQRETGDIRRENARSPTVIYPTI